ncbi:MAG: carboxylating nicotinate-nucleotide diphosphorylase [Actinomycetota bacterium]
MDERARQIVRDALVEDAAFEDVTTLATVPAGARGRARCVARTACVIAGLELFEAAFLEMDAKVRVNVLVADGACLSPDSVVAEVEGSLRAILSAERTALNFVQRLSGIATLTAQYVAAAGGVQVRDTRKTTPGWRALEKAAVRAGGGTNHRSTLAEAVLIKDNHIVAAGGLGPAVAAAKAAATWVEVECDTLAQVREALDAGADELLLDNMDVRTLSEAVEIVAGRARTEASGGVTLETIGAIARTGVDAISVGALTHSAPAADLSLEVEEI